MAAIKTYLIIILLILAASGCKLAEDNKVNNNHYLKIDSSAISKVLLDASKNFLNRNHLKNRIIELRIVKVTEDTSYVYFQCQGLYYFFAQKKYPTFYFDLNDNTFFVFTGAESFLESNFNEEMFNPRIKERCDSVFEASYIYTNGKLYAEKMGQITHPYLKTTFINTSP